MLLLQQWAAAAPAAHEGALFRKASVSIAAARGQALLRSRWTPRDVTQIQGNTVRHAGPRPAPVPDSAAVGLRPARPEAWPVHL